MNLSEIFSAAFFCYSMVFLLLGGLYVSVKLSAYVIKIVEVKNKK